MWRSYCIYYYAADKRDLLQQAIRPLIDRIAPATDRVYFLQHWLRGPHVRINVRATEATLDRVVRPALDEVVGSYLAAHPSAEPIDEAALTAQHQRLVELEHETGPLTPLRPDNSIVDEAYDRRTEVLGSATAADLLADFYTATTPLAFDMIDFASTRGRLVSLAFDVMIATAGQLSEVGLERGFVSFRSHAEAFLSWWPEAEGLRAAWDSHYAAHADLLETRAQAVLATGGSPLVRRWTSTMDGIRKRGAALIEAGELSMDPPFAGKYADDDEVILEMARKSPWHNQPRPPGEVDQRWFTRYRMTLNYTYLQLTRAGLTPVERFLLCHLAANTAERIYQVPAASVVFPAPGELVGPAA
jgi:Lantibiotic biosynthesis dehydratase C-term